MSSAGDRTTTRVIAVKRRVPAATPADKNPPSWAASQPHPHISNLDTLLSNLQSGGDPNDLHQDPSSTAFTDQRETNARRDVKDVRDRVVFRKWPRAPKGEHILYTKGKMAPNGLPLWGATLYDFFYVHRFPEILGSMTITTGSKLANWMKDHGETETCQEELAWAQREADPVEIDAPDMTQLIEATELRIRSCGVGKPMPATDLVEMKDYYYFKESPFDRKNYPAPWPVYPFSHPTHALQQKLDLHVLPQKLIVHDPWNVLDGSNTYQKFVPKHKKDRLTPFPHVPAKVEESGGTTDEEKGEKREEIKNIKGWTDKPDIIHSYTLELPDNKKWEEEAKARVEYTETVKKNRDKNRASHHGFMIRPTGITPGPIEPPLFIIHDPPPPPRRIPFAHLYLSPTHYAGKGSRAKAYRAELELPRYAFFEDILCPECISQDISRILKEEDGPNGERKDPKWKEKSAALKRTWESDPAMDISVESEEDMQRYDKLQERLKAMKVADPRNKAKGKRAKGSDGEGSGVPVIIDEMTREEIEEEIVKLEARFRDQTYTIKDNGDSGWRMEYEGPVRPIHTNVKWQNPDCPDEPCCSHLKEYSNRKGIHPLTARVSVIAKMAKSATNGYSSGEAKKYLSLPDHFSRHYSGYNVVQPLHDPVPVTPVVPQFYGYYEPIMNPLEKCPAFMSSIMLLEDCGRTLREVIHDPNVDARVGRCRDDRQELGSLVFRLHEAGFTHNSMHLANFLAQPGPLQEFPFYRNVTQPNKRQWSFRICGLRYLKDMLGDDIREWRDGGYKDDKEDDKEETEEEKKAREEKETKRSEKIQTFAASRASEEQSVVNLLRILHMENNWQWLDKEKDRRY
ncbi:hypothetical protein BDN72DRAFT_800219 [Pluteus cervinus]|uniref:Uncharacterized protein n=1 Tax=Pluteus cervinus TaxID=181527 RepID=A0ACD3AKR0_9AGAR|nr:hypothetical protein BDN72DRAFT_800219 [Pluteus cervinus]